MYNDITGIILAGGKSSRMGSNKSLLQLNGKTLIEHTASLLKSIFGRVILITNNPEEYTYLKLETFTDIYTAKGPLAGIHAGLMNSHTDRNFIISCDIPLITSELIKYLVQYKTPHPITVVRADGFVQHLCGVYHLNIKNEAEIILNTFYTSGITLQKPKCNLTELLNTSGAEIIDSSDISCYSSGMFLNINNPDDYSLLVNKN